jgi:hypothetical protein
VIGAHRGEAAAFVLLAPRLGSLRGLLRAALGHRWVESYQVGFGPPLVKANDRLLARLATARSAFDKLDAYLDTCLLEEDERRRLAALHRRLMVRLHGPLEAEDLDAASADVFDLSLRLRHPRRAPEDVRGAMTSAGLDPAAFDDALTPEALSGRFLLHLADPTGERLRDLPAVAEARRDTEDELAIELRVLVAMRALWRAFLADLSGEAGYRVVELAELPPHARVIRARRDA